MPTNLFAPLGLNPALLKRVDDAVVAEIVKAAYRVLVREYHPDKGGDAKRFAALQEAFSEIDPDTNPIGFDDALKMVRQPSKGLVSEKESEIRSLQSELNRAQGIIADGIRAGCEDITRVEVITRYTSPTLGGTEKESRSFFYRVPVPQAHQISDLVCRDVVDDQIALSFFRGKPAESRITPKPNAASWSFGADGSISRAAVSIVRFSETEGLPPGGIFLRGAEDKCWCFVPGEATPFPGRLIGVLYPDLFPKQYYRAMKELAGLLPSGRRATQQEVEKAALGFTESQFQPYLTAFGHYIQDGCWLVASVLDESQTPRIRILGKVDKLAVSPQAKLRSETFTQTDRPDPAQPYVQKRLDELRERQSRVDSEEEVRKEQFQSAIAAYNKKVRAESAASSIYAKYLKKE